MLNKRQAEQLFAENAVFIGNDDAVPVERVAELLGDYPAEAAFRNGESARYKNFFGAGNGRSVDYLPLPGFLLAVSFANVIEICKAREAKQEQAVSR